MWATLTRPGCHNPAPNPAPTCAHRWGNRPHRRHIGGPWAVLQPPGQPCFMRVPMPEVSVSLRGPVGTLRAELAQAGPRQLSVAQSHLFTNTGTSGVTLSASFSNYCIKIVLILMTECLGTPQILCPGQGLTGLTLVPTLATAGPPPPRDITSNIGDRPGPVVARNFQGYMSPRSSEAKVCVH